MKHYFIINPVAGPKNSSTDLIAKLQTIFQNKADDFEYYVSTSKKDTINKARSISINATSECIIYACGGDGTCFDVLNGIANNNLELVHFGIIPIGSCNDFLKTFQGIDFYDFEKVINGTLKPLDVLHITSDDLDCYALNEVNIGFDARVNDDTNQSKLKTKNVKKAYTKAVLKNFIQLKKQSITAKSNNQTVFSGKSLLLVCANGQYYGSKYRCAPFAMPDDGLFDFVLVKKVGHLRFASLFSGYEKGEHLTKPKYKKVIFYKQLANLRIESEDDLVVCIDGEIVHQRALDIEVLKYHLQMVIPND